MSVSSEVQRTLVKSPPELWSELSSPEALARHLGDFGDIKITSVEPETKVEWESEDSSGVVHLKQSGWGTKVTLSVTRTPPTPEKPDEAEPAVEPVAAVVELEPVFKSVAEVVVEPEPVAGPQAAAAEPEIPVAPERTLEPEPVATVEPKPLPEPEPEPRPGFFARLFRKRKAKPVAVFQPEPEPVPTPEVEIEVVAMAIPEPLYPEPVVEPEPVDLAAELASVEAQMAEETTELLTGVLDRLGAAHHRPFSRG
jgi:hypothetical protein